MQYGFDVPRTEHELTVDRSIVGALIAVLALLRIATGNIAVGTGILTAILWIHTGTTWKYYPHLLVGTALTGCVVHAGLHGTVVRPVDALAVFAVALYWRYR